MAPVMASRMMLCRPGSRHPWAQIRELDPFWRESGVFRPVGTASDVIPCDCEEGDLEEVFFHDGETYIQCRRSGRLIPIEAEMRFDWRLDGETLARLLADALDCRDCAPAPLLASRLWKLQPLKHYLGGINRDMYFAPNMAWNMEEVYYEALPRGSTQAVLLHGSSGFIQDGRFPRDRCFCIGDFFGLDAGRLVVDRAGLDGRLGADKKEAAKAKPKLTTNEKRLEKDILDYLREIQVADESGRRYAEERGRPYEEPGRIKLTDLAKAVGALKGTVSKFLAKAMDINKEIAVLWETYGVPSKAKKGSRKTGKRDRFERYNDEVDYGGDEDGCGAVVT